MKKIMSILLSVMLVVTMMPAAAFAENVPPAEGFSILWNNEWVADGGTLVVKPGQLLQGELYLNGKAYEGQYPFADSSNDDMIAVGVSPDGKVLEGWLAEEAQEGQTCQITIYYGEGQQQTAKFTVKAAAADPAITLKYGEFIVNSGEGFGGEATTTVEILLGGQKIPEGYSVGTNGNSAVCDVVDNKDGTFTIITNGNGDCNIIVDYHGIQADFTWHVEGFEGAACDLWIVCDDNKVLPGGCVTIAGHNVSYTGSVYCNGTAVTDYSLRTQVPPGSAGCTAVKNNDGTFTLTTPEEDGFTNLVIDYEKNGRTYRARIDVQVQTPERYVFQFNTMEPDGQGGYEAGGYATISIFKKWHQEKYVKFVITDQDMRRIDKDYYVAATPQNLLVKVYDKKTGSYIEAKHSPFTITEMNDGSGVLKIAYDRSKDFEGPAYMLEYTGADKYLDNEAGIPTENRVFIWTRSVSEMIQWNNFVREDKHWHYNAKVNKHNGMVRNDECDVKRVGVEFSEDLFGENTEQQIQVAEDTTMEIETDLGNITFDGTVLDLIDGCDSDTTLSILQVDKDDAEYEAVSGALENATCIIDLNLTHEDGKISDFGEGKVTVKLNYQLKDSGKKPHVYYVDAQGTKHLVECKYDAAKGELSFDTSHFSLFEIEEVTETTGSTGTAGTTTGTYVPSTDPLPPAKTEASAVVNSYVDSSDYAEAEAAEILTILEQAKKDIAAAKTVEEVEAIEAAAKAEIDKIETAEEKVLIAQVEDTRFKARSEMTTLNGKTAVKVTWNTPKGMDFDGYDVFRSVKRYSGYGKKPFFTTKKTSYINNKDLERGRTYYYKVRGFKYVNDEKVFTKWSWKAWRTIK